MPSLSDLFVDPTELPHTGAGGFQLFFLLVVYGFILFKSSKLIADGSELLALIMDPSLVGGLLLPIMGAVPDGAIVLFSALAGGDNPDSISVGVGALAGSTISLLTLPWFLCCLMGRVEITSSGQCNYKKKNDVPISLTKSGVQPSTVRGPAAIVLVTSGLYFLIQGPAFAFQHDSKTQMEVNEHSYALAGGIIAMLFLATYCGYCVLSAHMQTQSKERIIQARIDAASSKLVSLITLKQLEHISSKGSNIPLQKEATTILLRKLFDKYDIDQSGELDKTETILMMKSMGMNLPHKEADELFYSISKEDGLIQFEEFISLVSRFGSDPSKLASLQRNESSVSIMPVHKRNAGGESESVDQPLLIVEQEADDDDEDEDDEEEDESAGLTPSQIKMNGWGMLFLGLAITLFFSDAMVDVLTEVGNRIDVSPFYISFILAPLVSNASELISSIQFSAKKTRKSIDMTYQQLLGAATMNNTFCLAIFLIIIYIQKATWVYSSEVMAILFTEVVVCVITLTNVNNVLPLWKAVIIGLLYPASLALVWILDNIVGWQ